MRYRIHLPCLTSLLSLLLLVGYYKSAAQTLPPNLLWSKCYGGSNTDEAMGIQQTFDGGHISVGNVSSMDSEVIGYHGGITDIWVVKIDDTGKISWSRCYGGSSADYGYAITQTWDSGYIMTGFTASSDGDVSGAHLDSTGYNAGDMWVVKLDSTGAIQWQKCLGGSLGESGYAIQQTAGGYIVTGYAIQQMVI